MKLHQLLTENGQDGKSLRDIEIYGKTDFEGTVWDGNFYCDYNQLTSLEGAPTKVGEYFDCSGNQLTSLKGAPSEVGKSFNCRNNKKLTSLEGAPSKVGGHFDCAGNQLTSLKGAPF